MEQCGQDKRSKGQEPDQGALNSKLKRRDFPPRVMRCFGRPLRPQCRDTSEREGLEMDRNPVGVGAS